MKKFLVVLLTVVFLLSLLGFPVVSPNNSSKSVVKAADTDETEIHGMGCIPTPVETWPKWPKIDVEKLNEELISKGITALPNVVDLSSYLPSIGDQGSQGSCTAWATGYYYKTFQEGKEQSWSLTSPAHQFSPAFIYNQINDGHDGGSSIPDALDLLIDKGCDTLSVFPYNQYDYLTQPTIDQLKLALPFKATSYACIFLGQGSCTDDTINILKSWLANGDMFVIAIPVYSEFDYATNNPNYVVPPHNPSDIPRGWHALAVVGYNNSLYYTDSYGTRHYGAFKIANSWGPGYGYGGYVNLSNDFFKMDAREAWTMVDNPTPQGFTIGLSPFSQQVLQGGSTNYTITLSSLSGFNGNVSLSVSGLPTGITYLLDSTSVVPPKDVSLTLNVDSSVPSGTYSFAVSATSAATTYNVTGKVNVNSSTGLLLHVKNQSGSPAVDAWVELFSNINNYSDYSDNTDDTGSVYFPDVSGDYTVLISSFYDHFGLVKTVTAPGEYTFDTIETQHLTVTTKKKDGTSLPSYIWFVPFYSSILELGYSSGSLSVDVTSGTYTVIANGLDDHYLLQLPNVTVDSSTSQITLDASTMPTGTVTITPHGFDYGYVVAWGSYCNLAYGYRINDQAVLTYSADTYDMNFYAYIYAQDGSRWRYWLDLTDAEVIVINGSSKTIDVGGNLSVTTQPEKSSYVLGEKVKLINKVSDPYGNRLTEIYEYLPTASIDLTLPLQKGSVQPGFSASFGPLVKVIGPDDVVYYQSDSTGGFWSNSFTPSNCPIGTYTVNISLYTGPLQGVIYGAPATFTLSAFPPDDYEPDNDPANAKQIPTDGTIQTHNFDKVGDVDWIKFDAVAGKTYTIDTLNLGARCDTVIELYAPDGTTFIDYNDDFDSRASRIDFECPQGKSGTYYIKVRNYSSNTFGTDTNYDIRVYPALKISLSPEFCLVNTPTTVTITVTQDGLPVSGATVGTYGGYTQTTNSSGQAMFSISLFYNGQFRFDVTYGNYKRCYSYFWVIYSSEAIVEVKPVDKNGYYLTNYRLSTYYLSGSQYYSYVTNWWSGYNNTFRLLSRSGNTLVTLKKYYYYPNGTPYYMVKQASVVGNSKTNVLFNAQTETVTLNLTGQYNGDPFSYANVTIRNQAFNYEEYNDVGYTDSSGNEMLYVTPGTYTAVLAQDNWDGTTPDIVLCATNINASSDTTYTISYTSSQLGTLNRHAYDGNGNEIELYLEGHTNNMLFYTYSTGETLLLSPSTYQWIYAEGEIDNYPDDWEYSFILSETSTITSGSTQTINIGGHLTGTIVTDKEVYNQGETVNIKVRVNDAYGHPLDWIYHYNDSSSSDVSQTKEPLRDVIPNLHSHLLGEQGAESEYPYLAPDFDIGEMTPNSYSENPYIHLVVKDPSNATVVDTSDYDFWYLREYGYDYALPSNAPNGTYTINISLDTGPYQGIVENSSSFTVTSGTPTITLTQPNGGESLTGGSSYPIQWTSSGLTTGFIRILFYNGSSWSTVVTGLPLSQTSYSWTVPNIDVSNCIIRVGNYDTSTGNWIVYDDSDNYFTIISTTPPPNYFKTTASTGTETYSTTDTIHVIWDGEGFTGDEGKIRIFFYPGGGGPYNGWYPIIGDLALQDGSYDIDLSDLKDIEGNPITLYDPLRCRVRVGIYVPDSPGSFTGSWLTWTTPYGKTGQYYDETGHFWIVDTTQTKYFKTLTPTDSDIFTTANTIHVTWDGEGFTGDEGKIRIFFYPGGGGPYNGWYPIVGDLALQDGSYDIDLSDLKDIEGNPITLYDPLRCRVRVGIYVPDSPGSFTGSWLTWTTPYGKQGQYYDESGHFWVLE